MGYPEKGLSWVQVDQLDNNDGNIEGIALKWKARPLKGLLILLLRR